MNEAVRPQAAPLSQHEAFARIRLLRSPNIGPVSYAMLLARYGNAVAALEALPDFGKKGGRQYRAAPQDRIEREVEGVFEKAGVIVMLAMESEALA